ncbi:Alpha/beta-Hydrolases superfamily protein [Thalictrum thalictroides]|uniref:Alpha/beta-Hydrolases superfamily protein n=1 Tax=Thalictrum thalictroides TaxID=46969 RepID=A0A7J6W6B7_THATH|nr:Alpha/beta-Hydrolases superfamily protein [Thalictrum thalictroides]
MEHSSSSHKAKHSSVEVGELRITIVNKYGEKLMGVLHETCSTELVILCHGFRSSKECTSLVTIASALAKEGITAFRFDFSGNGESEGSFQYGNYHKDADDLRAVILHFFQDNRVIRAIVGHSKGGNAVLLYAARYNDVHTVVNISGRFNLKKGIEGRLGNDYMQRIKKNGFIDVKNMKGKIVYRVTRESMVDRLTTDVGPACLLIDNKCRVLTVHGSADEIVPTEDALKFDKKIPNHKVQLIEGANHYFTSHQAELAFVVVDFIRVDQMDTYNQVPSCKGLNQSFRARL